CKGMSQRAAAFVLDVTPRTIARRVERFGRIAAVHLDTYRRQRPKLGRVMLDELVTFEHTKLKPLTVPIAVEPGTRKIIALSVGQIAASGPLAAISRQKYGRRVCERH